MSRGQQSARLKIACVIPTMRGGGAERVVADLCAIFAARGDDIHLITLTAESEEPFYSLHPAIHHVRLGHLSQEGQLARVCNVVRRTGALRSAIKSIAPDVVLTHLTVMNVLVLAATRGLGIPVIVSEHTDVRAARRDLGAIRHLARRIVYPWADRITVLTKRSHDALGETLTRKVSVIPNPISPTVHRATPEKPGENGRYRVISVGRLAPEKQQHFAIEAFAQLASSYENWDFVIFGEGPLRNDLQDLIRAHGMEDRIKLPGLTREVGLELSRSHVFTLPSQYEGFPMSLGEGLAVGLPGVAYANVSGVEDLVVHRKTGLLADSEDPVSSLADQLATLMSNTRLRTELGGNARNFVQKWSPSQVFAQWNAVIQGVRSAADVRGGVLAMPGVEDLSGVMARPALR